MTPAGDSGFRGYLRTFLGFDPAAVRRAALLDILVALTEGAGLLLLLPLLSLAGVLGPGEAGSPRLPPGLGGLGIITTLETALLIFVALVGCQAFLSYRRDRESFALQSRFGDHLRTTLYATMAGTSWSFLSQRHGAELLSVLSAEIQRIIAGTHFLLRLFTVAVMTAAYLLVALWLSAGLSMLALAIGALIWILLRRTDRVARQSGNLLSGANQRLFTLIQEFLSALKLVKAHGEEAGDVARFDATIAGTSRRQIQFRASHARTQALYRLGGAIGLAVVSYAALTAFSLSPARLLVLIAIFARLLPRLSELHGGRQQILHMLPAYAAWRRLLDACAAHREAPAAAGPPPPLTNAIELDQVRFRHRDSHHAIHVPRLRLPAAATTAIVGVSGAGKTTLIDLLCGLLVPDQGTLRADGVPLAQRPGWRSGIAYIPQETLILGGTLRDNLLWGTGVPDAAELDAALAQAALADLVARLPKGLDTEVGERGVRLSGGERQRLALARALLRRPTLLILDEATSALDTSNHQVIADTLRQLRGHVTILVVSHRLDEFSGLIDGRVLVEEGQVGDWEPMAPATPSTSRP